MKIPIEKYVSCIRKNFFIAVFTLLLAQNSFMSDSSLMPERCTLAGTKLDCLAHGHDPQRSTGTLSVPFPSTWHLINNRFLKMDIDWRKWLPTGPFIPHIHNNSHLVLCLRLAKYTYPVAASKKPDSSYLSVSNVLAQSARCRSKWQEDESSTKADSCFLRYFRTSQKIGWQIYFSTSTHKIRHFAEIS